MTIQQCKYVLKIAECGSFNEASKQLFIAQSSLSVSIKSLERELGIRIFDRSGNGVYLTAEGAEFARYARQIAEQNDFVLDRYSKDSVCGRMFVSTQHYDFVADVFSKLMNEIKEERYRFSLREMKTYDVIRETENAYCDIGIIAIKANDYGIMERYITKRGLAFTPILKAPPHVYLRAGHPLAASVRLSSTELLRYPYVCYEQGEHDNSFFTEEMSNPGSEKRVEISDRASLMNVLLSTDSYTIGTGIMPSSLNEHRIIGIPFDSDDYYTIGYLLRSDRNPSTITKTFIEMLCKDNGSLLSQKK